jgi:hypothetical protein
MVGLGGELLVRLLFVSTHNNVKGFLMPTEKIIPHASAPDGPGKPGQRRLDWDRIERDHSTGRYTDAELAQLHQTARTTISVRRTRDRKRMPGAWPVDRSRAVKQATAAMIQAASVDRTIAAGNDAAAILGIAAASRDVILSHRSEIKAGREVAATLMAELADVTKHRDGLASLIERAQAILNDAEAMALTTQVREMVKLHNRVGSLQKLADAMARLQTQERKAFGISDDDTGSNPLDTMTESELQAEVDRLTQALGGAAG